MPREATKSNLNKSYIFLPNIAKNLSKNKDDEKITFFAASPSGSVLKISSLAVKIIL